MKNGETFGEIILHLIPPGLLHFSKAVVSFSEMVSH